MNTKQIKELAETMKNAGLTSLEIAEGELRIRMTRECAVQVAGPVANQTPPPSEAVEDVNFNDLKIITSPMVGVFYGAPAPDAAPFVKIGDKVKSGDVLCIVEAMKLMNEIVSDTEGEIVDICVKNGDVVEFGQVLFKLH